MRIVSGEYGGRRLRTAEGPGYRPATGKVRGAVFSMLEARGMHWPDTRVLDLFAGSGSLAIEGLSRGASLAWFVEKSSKAARIISENLRDLGVARERYRVLVKDVKAVLASPPVEPFDLIFIDPPYGKGLFAPTVDAVLQHRWLAADGFLLAEVESGVEPDVPDSMDPITDRLYGQTRIVLWRKN